MTTTKPIQAVSTGVTSVPTVKKVSNRPIKPVTDINTVDGADPRNPVVTPLPKVINDMPVSSGGLMGGATPTTPTTPVASPVPTKNTEIPEAVTAPVQTTTPATPVDAGHTYVPPSDGAGSPVTPNPVPLPEPTATPVPTQTTTTQGAQPEFSSVVSPNASTEASAVGEVAQGGLVEDRLAGLMSADNPLMQKAIVEANNISAQRGLQSSSIATENAINSMFQYGTAIASQDAQTIQDQNMANQDRVYTATENQVARDFTEQMEYLEQQNALGLLDAESKLRLTEMQQQQEYVLEQADYEAQLQSTRDTLLQGFEQDNIATSYANQLLQIEKQALESANLNATQNDFQRSMEYSNAISEVTNQGIEALGNAMLNPEITPDQYASITANIQAMMADQVSAFADIYGIEAAEQYDQGSGYNQAGYNSPLPSPDVGVISDPVITPVTSGSGGGGGGGLMGSALN